MIEFNGHITGTAEKRFYENCVNFGQNIMLASIIIFLPMIIFITLGTKNWVILVGYCSLFIIIPLILRIPKSKKERQKMNPKKITIQDGVMIAINGYGPDSKLVSDVKEVRDYGEFYEIVFPFGKMSTNFICQKDLLVKGSLEKFEKIFKDKLVRK